MGLIAPLFLLASLAIALPIWLHRLQTQSSDRKPFSSAMLLETTEQQVHVQKKLKYLLLLALRIALLLLVAFAFAKPFIERPPTAIATSGVGTHLIVLDASVSMGRSGVFEQARAEAQRAIDDAPTGAILQVIAADGALRLVRPPSNDKATQRAALASLEPGAERLDFGQLMTEIERYAQTLPAPVSLHLISDFQASGMPAQFADVIPAGIARLIPHAVGTGEPVNWGVVFIRQTAEGLDVAVQNQGLPDRTTDVEVRVNGQLVGMQTASGQGQYLLSFGGIVYEEGDNRIQVTLGTDDDLAADNVWHAVVRNEPPSPVPLLSANPEGLPVTYLSAALGAATDARFNVQPFAISEFDPRVLTRYRWVIVDDLGAVDPPLAEQLANFVAGGGSLLGFAGERTLGLESLPVSGVAIAPASVTGGSGFRSIGQLDVQHPVLSATEGWHRVNVSRTVPVEGTDEATLMMRLDNGEPLMFEQALGDGRLLITLSAIDNQWNDLPVHPVFVGFALEAAEYLSGRTARSTVYTTGDMLPLSRAGTTAGQVVDPDGETVLSLADTAREQMIRLEKPGIYEVYTPEGETLVAANIDPRESELGRISQTVLDRWQDATYSNDETVADESGSIIPEPIELWPWVLLLLAVFAIAESALGNVHIAMRTRQTA